MRLRPKIAPIRYSSRALQTWKYLGACAQQFRSKRPDEPTWRLPRSHQHQRWRVWKSEHKTPSQWASSTTTRSTICMARWRKWKSRPQNGMEMVLFNSLIKLIFDVLEIIWKMVAGVELGWTVFFFSSQCQRVELTSSGDSLVSDEGCKHYTKPTHTSHSRTRDFFSRGSRLESSSQQESLCLSEKSFSH